MVWLMKWWDHKGKWVVPSLSYNLKKFIGFSFKICLSWKKCPSVWISSGWSHVALSQMLTLLDVLANRSFCRSDISRVQLKSNWTVGERLLASDPEAVRQCRLILLKGQWTFFLKPNLKIYSFVKTFSVMEFLANKMVLTELFRLSDGLANQSFCRSGRAFWGSNWSPTEQSVKGV